MNIFSVHQETNGRIETFHTCYLKYAIEENQQLLDQFWAFATKGNLDWVKRSKNIKIEKEHVLADRKRVDIVLQDDLLQQLVAVEAKTTDSSVEDGQLDGYLKLLQEEFPGYRIWIIYLTPFNLNNRPAGFRGQKAIKEFEKFNSHYPNSAHLSWHEVSMFVNNVDDGIWNQHNEFVRTNICKAPSLEKGWGQIEDDLGWEVMDKFRKQVRDSGFELKEGKITLRIGNDPAALVNAMKVLVISEQVRSYAKCPRSWAENVKTELLNSEFGKFHRQIFQLLDEYPFLGIRGKVGYGLILPVKGTHPIVSICTVRVRHPEVLAIGRPAHKN